MLLPATRAGAVKPVPPEVNGTGILSASVEACRPAVNDAVVPMMPAVCVATPPKFAVDETTSEFTVVVPKNVGLDSIEIFGVEPPEDDRGDEAVTMLTAAPPEPATPVYVTVWFGHEPLMAMDDPGTSDGATSPVPPEVSGSGIFSASVEAFNPPENDATPAAVIVCRTISFVAN
jgi:hypothetical protein